jgi:hypothetical protein
VLRLLGQRIADQEGDALLHQLPGTPPACRPFLVHMAPRCGQLLAQATVEDQGVEQLPRLPAIREWTPLPRAQSIDIEAAFPALDREFDQPPEAIHGQNPRCREQRRWK